ncbi:MAG TPA: hypothetical protein VG650_15465 [Mycobacteriales bacterium]|nr:hypothetical protein [Mycobacteriales bacterium]
MTKRSLEPRVLTVLGILLLAAGCVLLGVAWGLAAGQTLVSLQLPYLLSAGLPGIGLVVVGVGLVVIGAREADARARRAQQQELIALLGLLRDEVAALRAEPPSAPRRSRQART